MASSGDSPDTGGRSINRLPKPVRYGLLGVFVVVAGLTVAFLAAVVWGPGGKATKPFGTEAAKEGDPVTSIGPVRGASLAGYIGSRKKLLASAKGPRVAVVSLQRYTSESEARAAVGAGEVLALLADIPGAVPSVARGDLKAWVEDQKRDAKDQRDGLQGMLRDAGDDRAQFEDEIKRFDAVIDYKFAPSAPLVFGVVVRADSERLRQIAASPGIRLVDIGPSGQADPRAAYRGIRPEETTDAGKPHDFRPL